MNWKKLGLIFCPNENSNWMNSYASYPWAEFINDSLIKCYFSCRDIHNKSSIGYVIVDLDKPQQILEVSSTPVITKGEIGTFDDSGVSFSCIVNINSKRYLYYLGWNLMVTVPWRNTIGLAIENDNGIFERYSKAPILNIDHNDPFTLTYPFVLYDEGLYKMWYGSSLFWGPKVEDTKHVIRYAESEDGIDWKRSAVNCIEPQYQGEFAIVKPHVIKEDGIYKMWYSYRVHNAYKIGYAESDTGIEWKRKDELAGICNSNTGWDSEMVCYPYIFDYKGCRYMLYNGNGYGKTGFGLVILEK